MMERKKLLTNVSPGAQLQNMDHSVTVYASKEMRSRYVFSKRPGRPFVPALPDQGVMKAHRCRGSMTLEAALILPFFLFVIINLLSIVEMYRCHAAVTASLWKSGRQMALYGYLYDKLDLDDYAKELNSVTISETYVRMKLHSDLEENGSGLVVLGPGTEGISLIRSQLMNEKDRICLKADFILSPPCRLYPGQGVYVTARYCGHAWNGYKVTGYVLSEYQEEIVYITETGTVYHKNRSCTYLNPSVSSLPTSEIGLVRNESGGIYHPCELCGSQGDTGNVYITRYGTVYHTRLQCSGLKRTVYAIKISEVGDRLPCSKCGGR